MHDSIKIEKSPFLSITVEPILRHSKFFVSCSDRAQIASFWTFLMKLRFRTLFMMYFQEKKIWQILIDFSTIFAIKAIGGSHIAHIREKCA